MFKNYAVLLVALSIASCQEDDGTAPTGQTRPSDSLVTSGATETEVLVTLGTTEVEGALPRASTASPSTASSTDGIEPGTHASTSTTLTSSDVTTLVSDASVDDVNSTSAADARSTSAPVSAPCERIVEDAFDCPIETDGYCYELRGGGYCAGPGELAQCPVGYIEQEVCLVCGLGGGCARLARCALPCGADAGCSCVDGVCSEQFCI